MKAAALPYRAVAFDLDGTALLPDSTLSERTIETIERLSERNIVPIITTARSRDSANRYRSRLGISTPMICYNGACVTTGTEELIHLKLDTWVVRDIIARCRVAKLAVHLYLDHRLLIEPGYQQTEGYEKQVESYSSVVDFDHLEGLEATKLLLIGDRQRLQRLKDELEESYQDSLTMLFSYQDYFEIMPKGANKRPALACLLDSLGIERDELIAFGDGENDHDMLCWAAHGVVMENAPDHVKRGIACQALPNSEDGMARYLEGLFGR